MIRNGAMIALYLGATTAIFCPLGCSSTNDVPELPLGGKAGAGGSKAATGGNAGFPSATGGAASTGGVTGGAPGTGGSGTGGVPSVAGATNGGGGTTGGTANLAGKSNSGGSAAFGGFAGFGGIPLGGGDSIGFGVGQTGIGTGGTVTADPGTGTGISISNSADPSGGCNAPGLIWKTGRKTNYESYPDPNSQECVEYHGCDYVGEFAACPQKRSEAWVQAHNIASVFPDLGALAFHDLCLKSGSKTIVVTVIDTCADSDCEGCCTQNRGNADELIDLEKYTNQRFGVDDGPIQWADLGPTKGTGCE